MTRGTRRPPAGVAQRIADLMAERGLSQGELARRSGVSQAMISYIVSGARPNPSLPVLRAIEDGLGDPHVDLVADPAEASPIGVEEFLASPWAEGVTPEEERYLRSAHWVPQGRRVTPRDWRLFLSLVRELPRDE